MGSNISDQIAKLPGLSRQELLDLWQRLYRRAAPYGMRRERMIPFLAYRIQENAYGGLKPSTLSQLRRISRSLEGSKSSTELILRPKAKVGTRMVRQWRGESHEVVVTQSGYEYRRATYKSLSEIARKITGTRWSGPAFFGLNRADSAQGRRDD
jgi:Protein of unknown function (DUF2924)